MAKSTSWDGKSLTDFLGSDRDYFAPVRGQSGNPMAGANAARDRERMIDIATGGGPRSDFFSPLIKAGIPKDQYKYYAKKADISNVNSKSDLKAIIDAYNKDQRNEFVVAKADDDDDDKKRKKEDDDENEIIPPSDLLSPALAEAKARVAQFKDDELSGRNTDRLYNDDKPDYNFYEEAKARMGVQQEDGNYIDPESTRFKARDDYKSSLDSWRKQREKRRQQLLFDKSFA